MNTKEFETAVFFFKSDFTRILMGYLNPFITQESFCLSDSIYFGNHKQHKR